MKDPSSISVRYGTEFTGDFWLHGSSRIGQICGRHGYLKFLAESEIHGNEGYGDLPSVQWNETHLSNPNAFGVFVASRELFWPNYGHTGRPLAIRQDLPESVRAYED
jgi:hypothetical protein